MSTEGGSWEKGGRGSKEEAVGDFFVYHVICIFFNFYIFKKNNNVIHAENVLKQSGRTRSRNGS